MNTNKDIFQIADKLCKFTTPPIHTHTDQYGDQQLCGKVICPHGKIGI